jgi:predicted Zn-dependent protease
MNRRFSSTVVGLFLFGGLVPSSACAQNTGRINFTSIDQEIELGKQLAAQIEPQLTLIQDPAINQYIDRVGQSLVRNSDSKLPVTFKVVKSDRINAFTLPGGLVYLNIAVVLSAENEAELAAVIATQVGHVAARHATQTIARTKLLNIATIPSSSTGVPGGTASAANLGATTGLLRFARKNVNEADFLGLQYLYKAGYDPNAAVSFLQKLQTAQAAVTSSSQASPLQTGDSYVADGPAQSASIMFSTHPPTSDRIEKVRQAIAALPARDRYTVTSPEFDQIKMRLAEISRN